MKILHLTRTSTKKTVRVNFDLVAYYSEADKGTKLVFSTGGDKNRLLIQVDESPETIDGFLGLNN